MKSIAVFLSSSASVCCSWDRCFDNESNRSKLAVASLSTIATLERILLRFAGPTRSLAHKRADRRS